MHRKLYPTPPMERGFCIPRGGFMSWNSFKLIRDGTRIFNHGYDQCVAVFNRYHESVLGKDFVPVASATQLWADFGRYAALRDTYRKSSSPVAGAVMVWDRSWGGGHGHVGVVLATHGDGTITVLEQNATHRWTHRYRRPRAMPGLLGYLIPHNNPATPTSPAAPVALSIGGKKMGMIYTDDYGHRIWAIFAGGFWHQITDKKEAIAMRKALGIKRTVGVSGPRFRAYRESAYAGQPKK